MAEIYPGGWHTYHHDLIVEKITVNDFNDRLEEMFATTRSMKEFKVQVSASHGWVTSKGGYRCF
jgi:hypothetical protein